jgi:uncharacterized membrane protein YjgN (DUF898 family)
MNSISPLVAGVIVAVTLGIAALFGWQQIRSLRWLGTDPELSDEDRRYFRRQAYRRLAGCGLLVAIGLLIGGYYVSGLDDWANQLAAKNAATPQDESAQARRLFAIYLIVVLMLLLALVIVAALDYWAIRGYGLRHLKQIHSDRKAMLEDELSKLRHARGQRNGQH